MGEGPAVGASPGVGRRQFLAGGMAAAGALLFSPTLLRDALAAPAGAGPGPYGPLQPPNEWGMMLPAGFRGRQIARGGRLVQGTTYPWHFATDGGAAFRTGDGGHVLVFNSEAPSALGGGSSAIRFAPDGRIQRAYRILAGTNLNCAGGPTPWGTWLSGEEHEGGMIWEADPAGVLPAVPRPALGNFMHEAAAVDPAGKQVYLTEDHEQGCLYRFTPESYPSLAAGILEVAVVATDGSVSWREVPDPNIVAQLKPTRAQVAEATHFDGGEGIWHHDGVIYFTTKGDKKVWAYHVGPRTLEVLYHHSQAPDAALDAVDNVTVGPYGDLYVCEDGGNMEICLITPDRVVAPFLRLGQPDGSVHPDHEGSELVGVAFDPTGTRMYFGSQRAYPYVPETPAADGALYEVEGPFRLPPGGVPSGWGYGPPAGERQKGLLEAVPGLAADAVRTASGLSVRLDLARSSRVHLVLRTNELRKEPSGNATHPRPLPLTLAKTSRALPAGRHAVNLPLRGAGAPSAILTVVAIDETGARRVTAQRLG